MSAERIVINQLRNTLGKMEIALGAIPEGIVWCGLSGNIEWCNKTFDELINRAHISIIGQPIETLLPLLEEDEQAFSWKNCIHAAASGQCTNKIYTYLKENEPLYLEINAKAVLIEERKIIIVVIKDVTEHYKIEAMKDEFVSVVSHELRTPLTAIRGALSLILNGALGDFPEKSRHMLSIAHSNCEKLYLLVNEIVDIEKLDTDRIALNLEPVEMDQLIAEAVAINKIDANKHGLEFKIIKNASHVKVKADADRIMQVLNHLLSNAIKFSKESREVTLSLELKNNNVRVSVINKGDSIPEKFNNILFEKFTQVDSSNTRLKGGAGLGLNFSKAIIEKHGGEINFNNLPDQKVVFYFELPVSK